MPEFYDRWLGPAVFHPFAVDLAARAARLDPGRILEVAAGTGVLTRELLAAVPSAAVTATDLNPAMVQLGSSRVPGASWRVADGLRLPFPDHEFDLVACQFGVMFFPDKAAGFAEAGRVLAPGGQLLFSTWDTVATHAFAAALVAGVERAFPVDPPTFVVRVPHGYADVDQVAADLKAGGLVLVSSEAVVREGVAPSAHDVAVGFCTGTPLRMAIEARQDLASAIAVVAAEMEARLGAGPVTGRMTAHVIEARHTEGHE
jgi:SAM-dependent methyltransferase